MKILIPTSELKSYARVLKKHNPGSTIKRTQILEKISEIFGFDGYNNYERFLNKRGDSSSESILNSIKTASSQPLNELVDWSNYFENRINQELGINCPRFVIFSRELPSTPFDKYISIQLNNIEHWPALRMSGVLYLLSLVSGRDFYHPQSWMVDWDALISYLKFDSIPAPITSRMERFQSINRAFNQGYHEGMIPGIKALLAMGDITCRDAIKLISEYLAEEQSYLMNITHSHSDGLPSFSFPLHEGIRTKEIDLDTVKLIRQQTNEHQPILLGTPLQPTSRFAALMGNTIQKGLTLSTEEIRENLLMLGSAGSGKTEASLCLLRQAVMNDTGAVYIDGRFDVYLLWRMKSMMRSHNRENDLIVLTLRHRSELGRLKLPDLVRQKKVVFIMLPALEKDPEILSQGVKDIVDTMVDSLPPEPRRMKGSFFPYGIYLNEVARAFRGDENQEWIAKAIDRLNKNRISVFAFEQDYHVLGGRDGLLASKFASHMIMKCECLDPQRSFSHKDIRDIVSMRPGEFRYISRNGELDPVVYQVPYANIPDIKFNYLVMS